MILKKVTQYKFNLRPTQSPTYFNLSHHLQELGWSHTSFKYWAHFTEKHFDFYQPAAEALEFKHLLAELVTQYCPHIMPLTFTINDNNWPLVLNQMADTFYNDGVKHFDQLHDLAWILKPSMLNNGQHIKIFQKLSEIEQHFLNPQRMGGEQVIQQYLQPHLLQGPKLGHKFSIRMLVVLTNYAGAYLYPQGYFNVGLKPYPYNDFTDICPHLTNEHLNDPMLNVVQIPTQQYELFKGIYPEIKTSVNAVIGALQQLHSQAFIKNQTPNIAIFGFDFMVDKDLKVWLLEANHAPCFPIDAAHPLQNSLYRHFWKAFIKSFVVPIASNQLQETIDPEIFEVIEEYT